MTVQLLSPAEALQNTGRVDVLIPGSQQSSIENLINSGRLDEANRELEQTVANEGETARNLLMRAMILYRQEDYESALEKLRRSFQLNEKDPDVHKLMGLTLTKLEKPKLAEPFFEIAVRLAPNDSMAHYYLGLHSYTTNQFKSAVQHFRKAIALRPDYVDSYCFLGLAFEELGEEAAAISTYHRAIEIADREGAENERAYFYLGRYLVRLQRPEQAIPWLRRAVHANPQAFEALKLLGQTLVETGNSEEALPVLAEAAQVDPQDPGPHYIMMRIYTKLGLAEKARHARIRFQELQEKKDSGE